jgi:3-oxoisoapionate decarboxylase
MKRREFLAILAAEAAGCVGYSQALADAPSPLSPLPQAGEGRGVRAVPRTSMGVVEYSFSMSPHTRSTLDFLEYCHTHGAGGVQTELDSLSPDYIKQVRRRAEELGMYLEVIVSLPSNDGIDNFEQHVVAAKQAGAVCLRSACLSGRRYETFSSLEEWKRFVATSRKRISLAVPILAKHQMALGLENHKDWTADDLVSLMNEYQSEYLGVCLDTGNNLALLDDPLALVQALAPFAVTTHFKDVAFEEYAEGFLLAEVPLGHGILDLRQIVEIIRKARPSIRFNLEMITRDPLRIPCLTEKYWATFPERNGRYLARILSLVRAHRPLHPLESVSGLPPASRQKLEEENVKQCLAYARQQLGLVAGSGAA